jgi:hypothetical protein
MSTNPYRFVLTDLNLLLLAFVNFAVEFPSITRFKIKVSFLIHTLWGVANLSKNLADYLRRF